MHFASHGPRVSPALFRALCVLSVWTLGACASEDAALGDEVAVARGALHGREVWRFLRGARLFTRAELGGNGVVCADCHLPLSGFDLAPRDVQWLHAFDPEHPIFNPRNSDGGDGASYERLLRHALVPVHVEAPPNVTVDEIGGPDVQALPSGRVAVRLFRAPPSSIDSALDPGLMWDGREGDDLAHQAIAAASEHAEGSATEAEAADIAFFQRQLFSSRRLRAYAAGGPAPELPAIPRAWRGAYAASLRRGRTFFEDTPITSSDMAHRGLCATCHSGPMLDTTGHFNPGDPPGLRFAGNRTSELNRSNLPEHTFRIALPRDLVVPAGAPLPIPAGTVVAPAGTPIVVRTSDPGALIVDTDPGDGVDAANPCISAMPCIVALATGTQPVVFHRIASLWGAASRGPYYHDNSAATLDDVVDHYREFFAITRSSMDSAADALEASGDREQADRLRSMAVALDISERDGADIVAYMRFAFR